MSRIARIAVLVTALASLLGIMSSAASAVTWHNTGSTSFTATGGPMTISRGSVNFACSGSSATGSAAGGSTISTSYIWPDTIRYSPCTLAGQNAKMHCTLIITFFAPAIGAILPIDPDWSCVAAITASGTDVCKIEGSTSGSYTNPSGGAAGKLTLSASSTLTVTNSTAACPLGTGSGVMTHHTLTVTGGSPTSLGPIITRTA